MVGVLEYELSGWDFAEVRFALSPANELTLSLRTFREPGRYPAHLPWLRETQEARERLDTTMLRALTNDELSTPDFLTPRPYSPLTRIDDELRAVARVDDERVRADLRAVHPGRLPHALRGPTDEVRARMMRALRAYWDACFAPWWPRMRAVLQADIVYRGHVTASEGVAAMFGGLSDRITLENDVVRVRLNTARRSRLPTRGAGLTLVPSLFTRGASVPISEDEPPMIMYGVRGVGTLWQAEPRRSPAVLVNLLGAARAGLLTALSTPASSTELAGRLGVTTPAVNQHLRAMRDAGLLTSARQGRSVLYLRSELGDALVAGGSVRGGAAVLDGTKAG
ncbi:ArsR/SmtB family transcription factor [Mumia sp. Pv 4-285]|uniref:ArsR/SmtB family transcription factor n=1 Tax=Mumia qirimensis TaxID=3234852 RepID=UPI00351D1575